MAFKTEAIILHHRSLRGSDRIYDVLTPRHGVINVIARSAAKSSSKMAGHLQPFAHVRLMIGRGHQDHLAGVTTLESFRELRESWHDFILASSLVELLERIQLPGQAAADEFSLLLKTLHLLKQAQRSGRDKVLIARIFLWKLLSLSGWKPNVESCAICRAGFEGSGAYYQPIKGFVCDRHDKEGVALLPGFLNFLDDVITNDDWDALISGTGSAPMERQWFDISQQYYHDIVSYPVKSLQLLSYA